MNPILNLFDYGGINYLKLLFVSKCKVRKALPGQKAKLMSEPDFDNLVRFVLAYVK
jgi:hypothetical protein